MLCKFATIAGRVVLLTHIDCVCKYTGKDLSNVFCSTEVKEVVKQASEITGVPVGRIFPVKNYVSEQDLNVKVNILLLLALQKIVHFSSDNIDGLKKDNFNRS